MRRVGPNRVANWSICFPSATTCNDFASIVRRKRRRTLIPPITAVDSALRDYESLKGAPTTMAATNINRVVLTGNLTRDPELRSLPSGMSVCSLRIASNTRRKENNEWVDKPNYFSVTVWGAQGEN